MSAHETPADIEAQRQTNQADHESQAFEQSDAAKVAAVAAVLDASGVKRASAGGWYYETVTVTQLRTALADPDTALAAVRAEARAEALRDAADEQERLADGPRALGNRAVAFKRLIFANWLRERAEAVARDA